MGCGRTRGGCGVCSALHGHMAPALVRPRQIIPWLRLNELLFMHVFSSLCVCVLRLSTLFAQGTTVHHFSSWLGLMAVWPDGDMAGVREALAKAGTRERRSRLKPARKEGRNGLRHCRSA